MENTFDYAKAMAELEEILYWARKEEGSEAWQ